MASWTEEYLSALYQWTLEVKDWADEVNDKIGLKIPIPGGGDSPPAPPKWPPA